MTLYRYDVERKRFYAASPVPARSANLGKAAPDTREIRAGEAAPFDWRTTLLLLAAFAYVGIGALAINCWETVRILWEGDYE